jgi:hypothetical protein
VVMVTSGGGMLAAPLLVYIQPPQECAFFFWIQRPRVEPQPQWGVNEYQMKYLRKYSLSYG